MSKIAVHAAPGRARVTLVGDQLAARVLDVTATGARVALVATTALLLAGDEIEIEVQVGPGAHLEIVDTAGTVAYNAGGVSSSWTVRITVADGGSLIWAGEPFVVADGAAVTRNTTIELGEGAAACLRETLILGRTGEIGGALRSRLSVTGPEGPTLIEELDLSDPDLRGLPGILGPGRTLDSVMLFGLVAPPVTSLSPGDRFDLDAAGTLTRSLPATLAASTMPAVLTACRAALARHRDPVMQRRDAEPAQSGTMDG